MQYQFNERYEYVKTIEFINSNPIQNIERIRYFKEQGVKGTFEKKEFRYSWDNATWTNWNTLTQKNLSSIKFRDRPKFYLHVKYTRKGVGTGNISRWYLFYDSDTPTPPSPPRDTSINADYLGGQPPSFYLDRGNHFGPYTGLSVDNLIADPCTYGVYSHRTDTSLGTTFFFKSVGGRNGIEVFETPDGTIYIDGSLAGGGVYESQYDSSTQVPNTIGGIEAGTTVAQLDGETISEMWDRLLFPTINPTFVAPDNTLSDNVNSLQEIGDDIDITFSATFNRGQILLNGSFQNYRSGTSLAYNYNGPSVSIRDLSTLPTNSYTLNNYDVTIGTQTWTGFVEYLVGPQPYDSKGNPFGSSLPAGNTGNKSVSFEGVYPLYATTVDTAVLTKQGLVSMLSGNNVVIDLAFETAGNKQKIDIPDSWTGTPTNRPLAGIETYNNVTQSWAYQGGDAATSLTYWTTSSTTHNVQGNTINYTRYEYNGLLRSSIRVRLKF